MRNLHGGRCPPYPLAISKRKREEPWLFPLACIIAIRRERRNRSSGQAGLGLLGDRAERRDVVHGEVRKHLAVDRDAGLVEPCDQAAVGQSELARSRVDADDPQRAELALLLLAADVGVLLGLGHRLLGDAIDLAPGVVVALGCLQGLLVTRTRGNATLDSCHGGVLRLDVRQHARDTLGVGLMHMVGGAQAAFALGRLLGQDVRLEGVSGLELAGRGLAEPLGGGPVGLDLWHVATPSGFRDWPGRRSAIALSIHALAGLCCDNPFSGCRMGRPPSAANGLPHYFFLGLIIMVIWRPSIRGNWSTVPVSTMSFWIRWASSMPSSWWRISRPQKRMLTLTLSPSSRNRTMLRSLML